MKKIFTLVISLTLVGSYTILPTIQLNAEARDSIQTEDPLCKIDVMNKKETGLITLREYNEAKKDKSLEISNEEKKLLARLVHAEAKGEPFGGKIAVATVVLNRVEHNQFPDSIKEVIYEKNAFEPVQNGSINKHADKDAYKAVQEALKDQEKDQEKDEELLYFYNPESATSDWILSRKVIKTIGNHAFAS